MIEPLANQTHSQGHAVYNAQSLKLPAGTCGHHHGDGNHTESLQELIDVMAEPQQTNRVRSWYCCAEHFTQSQTRDPLGSVYV